MIYKLEWATGGLMRFNIFWKSVALLALLIYAAIIFVVARGIVQNLLFAVIFSCTAAFLLYSAWLLFTATGGHARKARWYFVTGLIALVIELVYFLRDVSSFWAVLGVALLTGIYVVIMRVLRKKYWGQRRQISQQTQQVAQFKRPYLIINPKSGNGRAIKAHIDKLAKEQGVHVMMLRKGDDVEAIARQAARNGADVLGISGGDGSIGAVAKIAIESNLPVVVLPGGTRCHFARDLGLDPKLIADALSGFRGVERLIDVGSINGRIFLNNVSFGLYADIVDHPEYRNHKLDVARNVLQSIASGDKDGYDLQFLYGNRRMHKAVQVLVGVNPYNTLDLYELGHRDKLDAGVLQVTVLTALNDATIKKLLRRVSIDIIHRGDGLSDFFQWESGSFKITNSKGTIVAGVDGEREEYSTPAHVRVLPKALHVYVPAEGVRNRPKNIFSLFVVKQLWSAVARRSA
jgi:diacylglycerol kinase family enzyme